MFYSAFRKPEQRLGDDFVLGIENRLLDDLVGVPDLSQPTSMLMTNDVKYVHEIDLPADRIFNIAG